MKTIKAVIAILLASRAPGVAASSRRRKKMMKGSASEPTHNTAERKLDDCQTIVEIAVGNPDFSTLVAALSAAELVDALSGDGPFTVFGTYCSGNIMYCTNKQYHMHPLTYLFS